MLQLSTTIRRYLRRFIQTYRCFIIVDLGGGRCGHPFFHHKIVIY